MKNIIQYAYSCWIICGNSPLALKEFREEYNKFIFVNRILKKYSSSGNINLRLLLNHVIVLYNIFGDNATEIMFILVDRRCWSELHAILQFLNRIPIPPIVDGTLLKHSINLSEYPIHQPLHQLLNQL